MKCPKCGSENVLVEKSIDGFNTCEQCGYRWQRARNIPEPTTAEMLLWLAENESIDIWHTTTEGIIYVWRNGNVVKFEGKTLAEAIIKAYEWARKEVQNERNIIQGFSPLRERNKNNID